MTSAQRVLLVAPTEAIARALAPRLESAGYQVVLRQSFAEARATLRAEPDLVISQIKLGAYNGLHLAILAGGAGTPSIMIGDADPVLQLEAEHEGATYLTAPVDPERIVDVAKELLTAAARKRKSPRKRVPVLDALINDIHARLLDVSHEGMRIEALGPGDSLPASFVVKLPSLNFSCRVDRVWTCRPAEAGTSLWCGATLASSDLETALAWRELVDRMPGSSVMH